jgi:Ca2+-binding RTX toxin-like protein
MPEIATTVTPGSDFLETLLDQMYDSEGSVPTTVDLVADPALGLPVVGTGADETITGSAQNDVLLGNGGNDVVLGDAGDDIVASLDPEPIQPVVPPVVSPTPVVPDPAVPVVAPPAPSPIDSLVPPPVAPVVPDPASTTPIPPATPAPVAPGTVTAEMLANATFTGTDVADILDAATATTGLTATGGLGDDSLSTGAFNDKIDGGVGNDVLTGRGGKDEVLGGEGDDRFIWNQGDNSDVIDGGAGRDRSVVNGSADNEVYTLGSQPGADASTEGTRAVLNRISDKPFTLDATGVESTILRTGDGNDVLDVNSLSSTDLAQLGFDGGAGNDILSGTGSDIALIATGGAGDDFFAGGSTNDIFRGDAGSDILVGGAGSDKFLFETGAAFDPTALGSDRLIDFKAGEDKIALDKSTFAALQSEAGDGFSAATEFASVASDDLAGLSEGLIVYSQGSGKLFYNSNGAEDGFGRGAEFASVVGNPTLSADDFVIQSAQTPAAVV